MRTIGLSLSCCGISEVESTGKKILSYAVEKDLDQSAVENEEELEK